MAKRIILIVGVLFIALVAYVQLVAKDSSLYSKKNKGSFMTSIANSLDFLNVTENDNSENFDSISVQLEGMETDNKGSLNVKGDVPVSYRFKLIDYKAKVLPSFEVKLRKEHFLNRGREHKFYSALDKSFMSPLYANKLIKELNLLGLKYTPWSLSINDGKANPYYSNELYNKYLIEKQNVSNGILFEWKKKEEGYKVSKVIGEHAEAKGFITDRTEVLEEAIFLNDTTVLNELFDLDYLSNYFVFSYMTGQTNMTKAKMVYRMTNGKFYPLATGHKGFKNIKKKALQDEFWNWAFQSKRFLNKVKNWQTGSLVSEDAFKDDCKGIQKKYLGEFTQGEHNFTNRELNYRLKEDLNILLANRKKLIMDSFQLEELEVNIVKNVQPFLFEHAFPATESRLTDLGFELQKKDLVLTSSIEIKKDLIIPSGYRIVLMAGSSIKLDSNVNVLSYSPVFVNGTAQEPVSVTSLHTNAPFGIFGFLGDDKNYSSIEYLEVSNGSEAKFNGVYMSGGLNIYHQNAVLNHVLVFGNKADDGLNIKYGKISIKNCSFYENYADQVDLDYCIGVVDSCRFDNNDGDSNGDGLDFSGSEMIVENSSFNKFDDKGISVGENTKAIVRNNLFSDNKLGMAIKDLSEITVVGNTMRNNQIAFSLYQKKALFGGSFLNLCANEYFDNGEITVSDSLSVVNESCGDTELNLVKVKAFNP